VGKKGEESSTSWEGSTLYEDPKHLPGTKEEEGGKELNWAR